MGSSIGADTGSGSRTSLRADSPNVLTMTFSLCASARIGRFASRRSARCFPGFCPFPATNAFPPTAIARSGTERTPEGASLTIRSRSATAPGFSAANATFTRTLTPGPIRAGSKGARATANTPSVRTSEIFTGAVPTFVRTKEISFTLPQEMDPRSPSEGERRRAGTPRSSPCQRSRSSEDRALHPPRSPSRGKPENAPPHKRRIPAPITTLPPMSTSTRRRTRIVAPPPQDSD